MSRLLDEDYMVWLYSQVGSVKLRNKSKSHWSLIRQLYKKEFVWIIPNDDNRVEDGRDLRHEFLETCGIYGAEPEWMGIGCSMLEMLIGLSRRLSFEAEGEPRVWFWHLIEMLDLEQYTDRMYNEVAEKRIDETLDTVIFRNYAPDGSGGLFPLNRPNEDQREVEIWYQLNAYLLEL